MRRIAIGLAAVAIAGLVWCTAGAGEIKTVAPKPGTTSVVKKVVGKVTEYGGGGYISPVAVNVDEGKKFLCTAFVKEKVAPPKRGQALPASALEPTKLKVKRSTDDAKKLCSALKKAHKDNTKVIVKYKAKKLIGRFYNVVISVIPVVDAKPRPIEPAKTAPVKTAPIR